VKQLDHDQKQEHEPETAETRTERVGRAEIALTGRPIRGTEKQDGEDEQNDGERDSGQCFEGVQNAVGL
jgi:hypothetical protein